MASRRSARCARVPVGIARLFEGLPCAAIVFEAVRFGAMAIYD